jgi:two-component system cell cycle sensor histidine kinase/response regulator CckA
MARWYSQIEWENEGDRNTSRVVRALILAAAATFIAVALAGLYWADRPLATVATAGTVFEVIPYWLLRRGHMRASGLLLVIGALGTLTLAAMVGQGIHDYAIVAYPIIIVFAGLTLPGAGFRLTVVLTLGSVAWLVFGEAAGWFVPMPSTPATWIDFVMVAIVVIVGAFGVHLLAANLRRSLAQVQQELAQRKRAETELQLQEMRLHTILESTGDGILAVDNAGKVIKANQGFADLWQIPDAILDEGTDEALLAHVLDQLVDPGAFLEKVHTLYSSTAADSDIVMFKDGKTVERYSRPLLGEGGIKGRVWSFRDVTERVRADGALRQSESQLRQAQKMEAVGQLAGGIAHDFNNMLAAILGYSELLLASHEFATSSAREDLEEIKHAAERAGALTRQILAFSRRQTLQPTVVSLSQVIDGMEPLLRRTLGEDIDLVTLKDPGVGRVEADVHQFEQVLMNLAVNARDAMPSGGRLTLETVNVELDERYCQANADTTPGDYVMLAVSDTGVGMDDATIEHIFEPFFTTKPPGEGSGLGLATVYGIVRQSHGGISVLSRPGEGTSFRIYLPRVTTPVAEAIPAETVEVPARGDETILVVEDEAPVRQLVARVLGGLGYRVMVAGTGAEALRTYQEAGLRFDLLLTDVVLPGGMQGTDLARELLARAPDLPVLYISGYARDAIVHSGRLDAGVNFLEKPFTPDALAAKVRTVLNQAGGAERS